MDTAGESPVKRVKKTHRGRRSSTSQTKREQGTSGTFLVRLRLRGRPETMEQQVAALIQQVMKMSERIRQSEEAAEQARQKPTGTLVRCWRND